MGFSHSISFYFGLFMIVFYIAVGGIFIFTDLFSADFWMRYGLGIVFFLYGIYRFWRAIKSNRVRSDENDI